MSSSRIVQSLSLMIPRVFPQWIDEQKIIDIFHQQHLGRVYKVSIIRMPDSKKRSYPIYQAFIYFSAWYENGIAYNFQQRIFGHRGQARVVYDDPWFWVVFENKKHRLSNNDKRLMRLGFQAYLSEEKSESLEDRISSVEDQQQQVRSQVQAIIKDLYARVDKIAAQSAGQSATLNVDLDAELDAELALTETATSVAEFVLADPLPVFTRPTGDEPRVQNWNTISSEFASMTLGAELALTETAMSVAEAALFEDEDEDGDDVVPTWMSSPYDSDMNDYCPGDDGW